LYGLRVDSELRLPGVAEIRAAGGAPPADLTLRRAAPGQAAPAPDGPAVAGLACHAPCHNGALVVLVHRGPGGTWFWHEAVGTVHLAPGAREAAVYPEPGAGERALGLALVGEVLPCALYQRGYPCLHASAVLSEAGAIAFLGASGQGKSTLAAGFLRRGAALLTDDVLPLMALDGGIHALPGPPLMKLWRQTARCALALTEELPALAPTVEKRLLALDGRYAAARTPARLRALYLLQRYDPRAAGRQDIVIDTLRGGTALAALRMQTFGGALLRPDEEAPLLPLYARLLAQAPLRVLRYPDGYEHQEAVHARLLADLAGLAPVEGGRS
ncbi:MAG TPA: hypothetical protein VFW96_03555, partial [Thermomicrobiales bacterium]|nr:hypothetical protein [Thermomicrobiales bacterium]